MPGQRPGANEGHITLKYINQLRQFIQASCSQKVPNFGDARVSTDFEGWTVSMTRCPQRRLRFLSVNDHRSQFEDRKRSTVSAFASLTEQGRPAVAPFNHGHR